MGRQINFWMTQSDELAFIDRLKEDDAVWTPRSWEYRETPQPFEFDDWPAEGLGETIIVIRRHEWSKLKYEHIKAKLPFDSWTSVGNGSSPCFEFDTCKRGDGFISRGRIYFKSDWLSGKVMRVKPEEPTKWFDRQVSWLRRRGTKGPYKREFLMPDAAKDLDEGLIEINRDD